METRSENNVVRIQPTNKTREYRRRYQETCYRDEQWTELAQDYVQCWIVEILNL
jgi:hypothetical protein